MVTITITQIPEEAEEKDKEALATEAVAIEKITEITLQLPNCCLKENSKMVAYTRSLSLNAHIQPRNSKKLHRSASPMRRQGLQSSCQCNLQ